MAIPNLSLNALESQTESFMKKLMSEAEGDMSAGLKQSKSMLDRVRREQEADKKTEEDLANANAAATQATELARNQAMVFKLQETPSLEALLKTVYAQ